MNECPWEYIRPSEEAPILCDQRIGRLICDLVHFLGTVDMEISTDVLAPGEVEKMFLYLTLEDLCGERFPDALLAELKTLGDCVHFLQVKANHGQAVAAAILDRSNEGISC